MRQAWRQFTITIRLRGNLNENRRTATYRTTVYAHTHAQAYEKALEEVLEHTAVEVKVRNP